MIIFKFFILILLFVSSVSIGFLISKKYVNRVKELKDMKNALNIFETRIKFTYTSVPEVFEEIGKQFQGEAVGQVFEKASTLMKNKTAGEAWYESIDNVETNITLEDKVILKKLGKMLGKTNVEGQISEIGLVTDFLDTQINIAETEKMKNEKMYRTLGGIIGLTLVIILV